MAAVHGAGHVGCFAGAQFGGGRLAGVDVSPEHHHGRAGGRAWPACLQRYVGGLRSVFRADQLAEDMVDPREHRFGGPEVGRQDDRVADPLLGPQVGGDVGPAEPVDGLLRIPDQEQAAWRYRHVGPVGRVAGPAGGDADGQLDLDRVGVLELIQQQPPVLLVQGVPHGGAVPGVGEQVAGQDQQVVEFELSLGAAHLSGFGGRLRDAPGQLAQRGIDGAGPHLAGRGDERGAFGLELVQAVGQPAGLAPVAPFEVRRLRPVPRPGLRRRWRPAAGRPRRPGSRAGAGICRHHQRRGRLAPSGGVPPRTAPRYRPGAGQPPAWSGPGMRAGPSCR